MLNKRQQSILAFINEQGEARNSDLLELCGDCSSMTLWRDLTALEREGLIIRFRGGAASTSSTPDGGGREINFIRRIKQNTAEKDDVATIAAELIISDQSYYLDAGSTIFTLLSHIRPGSYNFITSATNIAAELASHPNFDVTMLGGQVNSNTLSCSGPQAEAMLSAINIDIAVMATSGYTSGTGFTSGKLAEAEVKKKVIEKSVFTIMLLDHDKLRRRHPFTFASLSDVDIVIGDAALPEEFGKLCKETGTTLFTPNDGLTADGRRAIMSDLLNNK